MHPSLGSQIKQARAFRSPEQEVVLGIRRVAAQLMAPWERFLKREAALSPSLYNVLRILRGSHPRPLTCGQIGDRTITNDPDITRLVDRLAARGLVSRTRSDVDRRVIDVHVTAKGLALLAKLDPHAEQMPLAMVGHVSKAKLRQLSKLLAEVMDGLGTYPPE